MTPEETAEAAKGAVSALGGGFMWARATQAVGAELGVADPWAFYVAGRAGVLGAVDADVVTAALVFFPRDVVRERWETALVALQPSRAALAYAESARTWGRKRLSSLDGVERLAELAERVAAAVDPAGLPLFAGWRALPLPDDGPGRAVQLLNVLREQRGNAHGLAVLAGGLRPLEALVAGPHGVDNARLFSWPGPFPDPAPFAERWQRAEAATTVQVAPAFQVLDDAERSEFVGLLEAASAMAFRR